MGKILNKIGLIFCFLLIALTLISCISPSARIDDTHGNTNDNNGESNNQNGDNNNENNNPDDPNGGNSDNPPNHKDPTPLSSEVIARHYEMAEGIIDDFASQCYRGEDVEKTVLAKRFKSRSRMNKKTDRAINDAFYKVTAEPLSFAFAFLEWYKLNNSEIKDFNGIYFYWNENEALRITLSEKYEDIIAIDYYSYHMIIHSGTVDYVDEDYTGPYVISYGYSDNLEYNGHVEYHNES